MKKTFFVFIFFLLIFFFQNLKADDKPYEISISGKPLFPQDIFCELLKSEFGKKISIPKYTKFDLFSKFYRAVKSENANIFKNSSGFDSQSIDAGVIPVFENELVPNILKLPDFKFFQCRNLTDVYLYSLSCALISFYSLHIGIDDYEIALANGFKGLLYIESSNSVPENSSKILLLKALLFYSAGEVDYALELLEKSGSGTNDITNFINYIKLNEKKITDENNFGKMLKILCGFKDYRYLLAKKNFQKNFFKNGKSGFLAIFNDFYSHLGEKTRGASNPMFMLNFLTDILTDDVFKKIGLGDSAAASGESAASGDSDKDNDSSNFKKINIRHINAKLKKFRDYSITSNDKTCLSVYHFLINYLRISVYENYHFEKKILASENRAAALVKDLKRDFDDPVTEFISLIDKYYKNRYADSSKFYEIFKKLPDEYFGKIIFNVLKVKFKNDAYPIINYYQKAVYNSCWKNFRAGTYCDIAWKKKAGNYFNWALKNNKYLPVLYYNLSEYNENSEYVETGKRLMPNSFAMEYDYVRFKDEMISDYGDGGLKEVSDMYLKMFYESGDKEKIFNELYQILKNTGNCSKALEVLDIYYKENSRQICGINAMADGALVYMRRLNNPEKALEILKKLEWYGAGSVMLGMAEAYEMLGDIKNAEKYFDEYSDRYGDGHNGKRYLFYIRQKNFDKLEEELKNLYDWNESYTKRRWLFNWAFETFYAEYYPSLVINFYEKIFNDTTKYSSSYDFTNLAVSYICAGQDDKAAMILNAAEKMKKTNPFTYYLKFIIDLKKGKKADYSILDNVEDRDYHGYLRKVLKENINYKTASAKYNKTFNKNAYHSTFNGIMGYFYILKGDKKMSQKCFEHSAKSRWYGDWPLSILSNYEIKSKRIY